MKLYPSKLIVAMALLVFSQTACSEEKASAPPAADKAPAAAPASAPAKPAAAPSGAIKSSFALANTCAGCHGTNGQSAGDSMPSLAGLDERYFYKTMKDFQSGARPSTIMGRLAKGYSDNEMKAMADFFAGQPWFNAKVEVDKKLAAEGKKLHMDHCESCHEQGGTVSGSKDTPRIAGQWRPYLLNLLTDLHTIGRSSTQPIKMRQRVQKLSQEELEALSHYYASQQEAKP
ncbi:c-type cytochrome [Thiothrix fructosivorans]|uniref:Cytochrome c4 n=1 Tax=Thiothrix fructosivorans TaxID=111770 RepID=A0A8B0SDL2_9GAMM|nr:c-type cytochrome [Thiothrix fructosivorans]MBO0615315.1 cytochrome c4 [Thiothrix fructosivorans]QTX10093.1 cytochrome c4 [Thiothrix fructosivorans]